MARAVVGNPFLDQIPTVSATAVPVETFKKPILTKGPLEALAGTLTRVSAKADPVLQRMQERKNEADYAEGQQLWADTRVQFGEAVKNGTIKPGESPYLRKGYRVANLNVLGAEYANQLRSQMAKRNLHHNSNPEKIEEFITKFQSDFRDNNGLTDFGDVETAEFFLPSAMKANVAFKASWREKNTAYMTTKVYEGIGNNVSAYTYSITDPTLTQAQRDKASLGLPAFIKGIADQAKLDGLDNAKVGSIISDALRMTALETGSTAPLTLMDNVQLGTNTLGSSIENRKANRIARAAINREIEATQKDANDAADDAEEKAIGDSVIVANGHVLDLLSENPLTRGRAAAQLEIQIKSLQDMGTLDASEAAIDLAEARNKFTNWEDEDNPDNLIEFAAVVEELRDVTDTSQRLKIINKAINSGALATQAQINEALNNGYGPEANNVYDRVSNSNSVVQQVFNATAQAYLPEPFSIMSGRKKNESDIENARLRLSINDEITKEMAQWIQTTTDQTGSAPTDFALRNQTQAVLMQAIKSRQAEIEAATLAAQQSIDDDVAALDAAAANKKALDEGWWWQKYFKEEEEKAKEPTSEPFVPLPVQAVPDVF